MGVKKEIMLKKVELEVKCIACKTLLVGIASPVLEILLAFKNSQIFLSNERAMVCGLTNDKNKMYGKHGES